MAVSAFPIDPALTAIAIAYKNPNYIADVVLPRVRVGKQRFSFMQYADEQYFNVVDTRVGRRGRPNQVELTGTEVTDITFDEALDGGVPQDDIDNADERYDPVGAEVEFIMEMIKLRREQRTAGIVFNTSSYNAALVATLSGTSQFSDYANSDPVSVVNDALDQPLIRPNQMVFGQAGWTKFRSHPKIVQATKGTAQQGGIASREQVAELFEVDEVVVGAGRMNANARGQTPSLARLWGKHLALLYKAPVVQAKGVTTFGATFEFGTPFGMQEFDRNIGASGGQFVRAGERVKERVVANQCGYFFQNIVA